MAEQTDLLSELLTKTDALISSLLWNSWDRIDSAINGWAEAMLVLYIVTLGLEAFLALSDDIWLLVRNLFRGLIVYALATNMPLLFDVSLEVTQDVPVAISDVIIGGLGADDSTLGKLDEYYVKAGDMALVITKAAGWNLWVGLSGLLIWLVSFIFMALVAVTLILAKIGFAVLFSVAPIFVVCYMFTATRPLFNGWLQQTINLALIPLFVYLLLAVCAAPPLPAPAR